MTPQTESGHVEGRVQDVEEEPKEKSQLSEYPASARDATHNASCVGSAAQNTSHRTAVKSTERQPKLSDTGRAARLPYRE